MDDTFLLGSDTALVILDRVKPSTFAQLAGTTGENNWYISAVTVSLIPTDDQSGVDETVYRIDGGSWITYDVPFAVNTDGVHTIEYYSTDVAGNSEEIKTVGVSIDTTPPEVTLTIEKIRTKTWSINVTANDVTSGVNKVEFYIDDLLVFTDSTEPYGYLYVGPKDVTAKVIVYDNAGLKSSDEGAVSVSVSSQPQVIATIQTLGSTTIENYLLTEEHKYNIQ
jgi:hypothetical protein